jgi:hypothetical protein
VFDDCVEVIDAKVIKVSIIADFEFSLGSYESGQQSGILFARSKAVEDSQIVEVLSATAQSGLDVLAEPIAVGWHAAK